MKKFILLFFMLVTFFSCQEVSLVEKRSLDSQGDLSSEVRHEAMTANIRSIDAKELKERLKANGIEISEVESREFIEFAAVMSPVLLELRDEIPNSLLQAKSAQDWKRIAEQDPEAAAFVKNLEVEVGKRFPGRQTISCSATDWLFEIAFCFFAATSACPSVDACIDILDELIEEIARCVLEAC